MKTNRSFSEVSSENIKLQNEVNSSFLDISEFDKSNSEFLIGRNTRC